MVGGGHVRGLLCHAHVVDPPRNEPPPPRWAEALEPPPCPEGWTVGPPDFIGVGTQRSGSSWWYRFAVESHPRVARVEGQPKELHFFDRFWQGDEPGSLAELYASFFPRPPGAITGEWTPRYVYDHWAMRLLAEAAPGAKVLVMLRDPVERYRSGLARQQRASAKRRAPLMLANIADQVWRGAYFEQLRRLFDFFPREQVLVLQYERCAAEPLAEMKRTASFLGLEPNPDPPPELTERRRPPTDKPELPAGLRADLIARLAGDVARTAELCPDVDVSLWPNFAEAGR